MSRAENGNSFQNFIEEPFFADVTGEEGFRTEVEGIVRSAVLVAPRGGKEPVVQAVLAVLYLLPLGM